MKLLLFACVLVACGGAAPGRPTTVVEPVDPPCSYQHELALRDGKLRCRELPLTIDFPAGVPVERDDDQNISFIHARTERGALMLVVAPLTVPIDGQMLRDRVDDLVRQLVPEAVLTETAAPSQPGATASAGVSFASADGGLGVAHAYLAHGWFIVVTASGRLAGTPARPDQPIGKAFLASLKLRAPAATWGVRDDLLEGFPFALPLAAWEVRTKPPTGKLSALFAAVEDAVWIGLAELPPAPKCDRFQGITEADIATIVRVMEMPGSDRADAKGSLVNIGDAAFYAELPQSPNRTMGLYVICSDPQVVLVSVTGEQDSTKLRQVLDRVTSHFKR